MSVSKRLRASVAGACILLLCACQTGPRPATAQGPVAAMERFITAFVAGEYQECRRLLASGATITIVRSEDGAFAHSHLSADEWLANIEASGVKELEGFTVEILARDRLDHPHGSTVTLKFIASGRTGDARFTNNGFDTGNLVLTPTGWRILHYSSFEAFEFTE